MNRCHSDFTSCACALQRLCQRLRWSCPFWGLLCLGLLLLLVVSWFVYGGIEYIAHAIRLRLVLIPFCVKALTRQRLAALLNLTWPAIANWDHTKSGTIGWNKCLKGLGARVGLVQVALKSSLCFWSRPISWQKLCIFPHCSIEGYVHFWFQILSLYYKYIILKDL